MDSVTVDTPTHFPLPIVLLCISGSLSTRFVTTLKIIELRQEWIPSDPSGVNHNLSVVLKDHDPIDNDATWKFFIASNEESYHDCTATNTDQTDLICEGNFENAKAIGLIASDISGNTVGFGSITVILEGNEF